MWQRLLIWDKNARKDALMKWVEYSQLCKELGIKDNVKTESHLN